LKTPLEDSLVSRGYKVKKSESAKIIEKFNNKKESAFLLNYLKLHPSCRVLFNILKNSETPFIEPMNYLSAFQENLELSNTSFMYLAECSCGAPLDKPNISNMDFKLPSKKEITCHKCDKINKITPEKYKPFFKIKYNDFIKFLNKANEYGLFYSNNVLECFYCDDIEFLGDLSDVKLISDVKLKCPDCGKIRYISPKFLFDAFLAEIIQSNQGYWLEWYLWNQLKNYNFETGKILIKKENGESIAFEIDGGFIHNNKCIVFECKDNDDLKDTIQNLHFINEFTDKWVLVTTKKLKDSQILRVKSILKNKFVFIQPPDVDNVKLIVDKLFNN
jgi:hypothetical protein